MSAKGYSDVVNTPSVLSLSFRGARFYEKPMERVTHLALASDVTYSIIMLLLSQHSDKTQPASILFVKVKSANCVSIKYRSDMFLSIDLLFSFLCALHLARICVLQICLYNIIPILPYSSQSSFLHDCSNDSS